MPGAPPHFHGPVDHPRVAIGRLPPTAHANGRPGTAPGRFVTPRRPRVATILVGVVLAFALGACRPVPGPIDAGYVGPAYAVPGASTSGGHRNEVPVAIVDNQIGYVGVGYAAAGQVRVVSALTAAWDGLVTFPWNATRTAIGARGSFWAMPSFVDLKDMTVTVDGITTLLGDSGLRYHRGTVAGFDDPATPQYDGIALLSRRFLACQSSTWSIGNQTFTTDLVELGLHRRDRSLIDQGVAGLDWGVSLPIDAAGVHRLRRDCDGATVADFGGTHHTTQWLESLGRAVYLLASSSWAGDYRQRIDTYIERMEQIATRLVQPDNYAYWQSRWLRDGQGNVFTHKAYMRAAALGLAATLTDNPADGSRWAADAATAAQFAMAQQWPDGVNPERGGYDVSYQMYGTWLAQIYHSTLGPSSSLRPSLEARIDLGIEWMTSRIDPRTGQIDIGASTRTCSPADGNTPYDAAVAVRSYLFWGHTRPAGARLVDLAILMAAGHESPGNPCPG